MSEYSYKKPLTTKYVEALKPKDKLYRVGDSWCQNMGIIVHPTGRKSWNWRGRVSGILKVFTLGRFPVHSLADAREWSNALNRARDAGVDVMAHKAAADQQEEQLKERTCDWLFHRYMENEGNAVRSAKEKWRIYNREIKPTLGSRSIFTIKHNDLANLLQGKLASSPSGSNNMQALIRRWFKWSVSVGQHTSGLTIDPAANLVKLSKPKTRSRFLDDYELRILLELLYDGGSKFADPIRLILYTGLRRSEAFELEWSELDSLDDGGKLILPGERTKNGRELVLPLPDEMVVMLKAIPRRLGRRLVWQGSGDEGRPMSGFSKAIASLNVKMARLAAEDGRTVVPWTLHDLRRSVVSGMNGLHDDEHMPLISELLSKGFSITSSREFRPSTIVGVIWPKRRRLLGCGRNTYAGSLRNLRSAQWELRCNEALEWVIRSRLIGQQSGLQAAAAG